MNPNEVNRISNLMASGLASLPSNKGVTNANLMERNLNKAKLINYINNRLMKATMARHPLIGNAFNALQNGNLNAKVNNGTINNNNAQAAFRINRATNKNALNRLNLNSLVMVANWAKAAGANNTTNRGVYSALRNIESTMMY